MKYSTEKLHELIYVSRHGAGLDQYANDAAVLDAFLELGGERGREVIEGLLNHFDLIHYLLRSQRRTIRRLQLSQRIVVVSPGAAGSFL